MTFSFFRIFPLFLCFLFSGLLIPVQAFADDEDSDVATVSVREKIDTFTENLDEAEKAHFHAIAGSHNLIQVVKVVQDDVEEAIEKCSDNNPDMADALENRYESWDDAIDPVIEEAEANVKNMIIAQDYAKEKDIRNLLEFMDDTRESRNDEIDKIPVTTPEACEYLRNKMDETEENMIQLLRTTLVSLPQTLKQAESEEPEEEPASEQGDDAGDDTAE